MKLLGDLICGKNTCFQSILQDRGHSYSSYNNIDLIKYPPGKERPTFTTPNAFNSAFANGRIEISDG
jgi:hypothetical protein